MGKMGRWKYKRRTGLFPLDFTTDNFAVIYIDKSERFWLIDKLTAKRFVGI